MGYKKKTLTLGFIALGLSLLYILYDLTGNIGYILPKRIINVVAIILTGGAIAFSTTIFMTITNNRILTPSVMGLDSLYMLIQTVMLFLLGSNSLVMMNTNANYLISIFVMVIFSLLSFRLLYRSEGKNIYYLLLVVMILGTFFISFTSFMQVLIDTKKFMLVQDKMFASVNNVNTNLVYLSIVLIVIIFVYFLRY